MHSVCVCVGGGTTREFCLRNVMSAKCSGVEKKQESRKIQTKYKEKKKNEGELHILKEKWWTEIEKWKIREEERKYE